MSCARCWRRSSGSTALAVDPRHAGTFFEQLRLLSGRLAFKLASATANQRTEVLGLALARLYLDYQGALADQIVLPLDDHLELYRDARRAARRSSARRSACSARTWRCGALTPGAATITCRLVEVKCYSAVRGESGFEQLKERIAAQLGTQRVGAPRALRPGRRDGGPAGPRGPERGAGRAAAVLPGPGGAARRHARRRRRRGRMAAREPRQRQVPAAVHKDRSDLRPVRGRDSFVVRRRHRIPPDRARPDRGAAGRDAHRSRPGRQGRQALSASTLDVSLPKLADRRLPRARSFHETPEEPASDVIDPSLDDLGDDLDDEPDAGLGRRVGCRRTRT